MLFSVLLIEWIQKLVIEAPIVVPALIQSKIAIFTQTQAQMQGMENLIMTLTLTLS